MKDFAKRLIELSGFRCFRSSTLPAGVDECVDIRRLRVGAPVETIFDVGANVGSLTLRFARRFPSSRIYSFEPFAETYDLLRRNTAGLSGVTCVNQALGSKSETRQAVAHKNSGWNSLLPQLNQPTNAEGRMFDISVTTVDEFCHSNAIERINMLKTDTEGFDLDVLCGARGMLESGSVDFVLSEAGFTKSDIRHTYFFDLHKMLESFEFKFVALYETRLHADGMHWCNALFKHSRSLKAPWARKIAR